MPGPCDDLKQAYWNAYNADRAADLAVTSADHNLSAAYWSYAGALAAELACGLTIETVIGFLACEAAAVAAAEAAIEWIESAEAGLESAEINAELTEQAMDAAHDAWCDCMGN